MPHAVEPKNGTDYALLMVIPPEPTSAEQSKALQMPRETILIIDTSGSMGGDPMTQAKEALRIALDTLRPGDRFNLIEFNSNATQLFATYAYQIGIGTGLLSEGAAISLAMFPFLFIIVVVQLLYIRRVETR